VTAAFDRGQSMSPFDLGRGCGQIGDGHQSSSARQPTVLAKRSMVTELHLTSIG
jgi:hypothetical protein